MGYVVRAVPSVGATALGALLLLADSAGPHCATYGDYQRTYDYTNGCPAGAPAGRVAFTWRETDSDGTSFTAARTQLSDGGLPSPSAEVDHTGKCSDDGEGHAEPEDVRFELTQGSELYAYSCGALHLHRPGTQIVKCSLRPDAGVAEGSSTECAISFTPVE